MQCSQRRHSQSEQRGRCLYLKLRAGYHNMLGKHTLGIIRVCRLLEPHPPFCTNPRGIKVLRHTPLQSTFFNTHEQGHFLIPTAKKATRRGNGKKLRLA